MGTPVLLIIDVINHFDFPGAERLATFATDVSASIRRLRDRFDGAGAPVVYVNDNWAQWIGEFSDLVTACLQADGAPSTLAATLAPGEQHYHVLKPKHSGFMDSALTVLLQQLDADRLVITGLATDSCVLATALDAHMRDYPVWCPSDCSAAITMKRKSAALAILRSTIAARTVSTRHCADLFP